MKFTFTLATLLLMACSGKPAAETAGGGIGEHRVEVPFSGVLPGRDDEPFPIEVVVETDVDVPMSFEVWLLAARPNALLATGDMRLLPDSIDFAFVDEPPFRARPPADIEEWSVEANDARVTLRTTLNADALDQTLWVCLTSENPIPGCAPQAIAVEPTIDATTPRSVRFDAKMRGGVHLRLIDENDEPADDCAVSCETLTLSTDDEGRVDVWPLNAGVNTLAVVRSQSDRIERREFVARVGDGRMTDLGTVRLNRLADTCVVCGYGAHEVPLDFSLVVQAGAKRDVRLSASTDVEADAHFVHLAGTGWDKMLVTARPWNAEYDEVVLDPLEIASGFVAVHFARRSTPTMKIAIALRDGEGRTCDGTPLVFMRPSGEQLWRAHRASYIGCSLRWYSISDAPTGFVEIFAWNPKFSSAAWTTMRCESALGEEAPWIEVTASRATGGVRGVLAPRVKGHDADVEVQAWIQPLHTRADIEGQSDAARAAAWRELYLDAGEFTFGGVPAGVDLELLFAFDGEVLHRRRLNLAADRMFDLGRLELELD